MGDNVNTRLADWFDDLTVRFLLNLPASELSSVPRLCFQVEEAQWFYEDFIRPAATAAGEPLPSLSLRQFCLQLFQHCPLLSGFTDAQHIAAYEEFLAYKVRVPVRGAILMDESMEKLVLVKGWKKGASWSFPRGKINKDEKDLDCAIREVYEETGYDVRQAGLIPDDEDDAKYIDVTMREQHMRLFVFRGVSETTHFEPQTRKEISKIAWYNVRDLPGFKKHKQGDYGSQANKFYMVAPFLGPLKKWINQQRRQDAVAAQEDAQIAAPGSEIAHGNAIAEETDTVEEEQTPAFDEVDSAAELKRLLSIGAPAATPAQQLPPANEANGGQANHLLALLQGGPKPPQTPLEQINLFPRQPESPHPHHPRPPSMGYQQSVPRFPLGPQQAHIQQRHPSQTNTSAFGPGPGTFTSHQQQPVHPHVPQPFAQQPLWPPGSGGFPAQAPQHMPRNSIPVNAPPRHPMPPQHLPPQQYDSHYMPRSSDAFMAQGAQGAIAAGPAVPKAEHLPMPKLNPQSMKLLDAFKSGNRPTLSGPAGPSNAPRQASQHQAALLGLFKKPSITEQAGPVPAPENEPSSPTLTDATERPVRTAKRQPTLSEITRTLPAKLKAKEPPTPTHQPPPMHPHATMPRRDAADRPKSRQLFDPANPKAFVRAPAEMKRPDAEAQQPASPNLQRPPHQHNARLPNRPKRSPQQEQASPAKAPMAKAAENGAPNPPFTILPRPGSSAKSPSVQQHADPYSRSDAPKPPFQVLKRPESVDPATVQKAAEVVERNAGNEAAGDKRDQLLALFGKSAAASPTSPSATNTTAPQARPNGSEERKNSLLNLFNRSPVQSGSLTPAMAAAPPAPQLVAERRPSRQDVQRRQTPQNAALLDLFSKPSTNANTTMNSPGTPISPFTLGTPAQARAPVSLLSREMGGHAQEAGPPRSRLNSVTTGDAGGNGSRKGSGAATPVEAKGFLLDYLNRVVQKEGNKAGKRP